MLHCLAACRGTAQKTGLNTVRQQSLAWPGLTPSVTPLETAYPGNPPPDFHPQDSSCKTAEIRLAGAWTCSVATALLQTFPCQTSKDCKIIYLHQTSQWEAWSHSGCALSHLTNAEQHNHAEMSGRDWHTHTHGDHRATWGERRQASTHTLCAVGLHTVIKKDGGLLHICQ